MPDAISTVFVIDDDPKLLASVERLLRSLGVDAQLFSSISELLKSGPPDGPSCLVFDVEIASAKLVSSFSASSPRRTGNFQLSSSQDTATS